MRSNANREWASFERDHLNKVSGPPPTGIKSSFSCPGIDTVRVSKSSVSCDGFNLGFIFTELA